MDGVGRVGDEAVTELASARTRKRDSLFMTAKLSFPGTPGSHDVRVRNLSEGGLMAEYGCTVEPGAAVLLDMRGLGELSGTVAWNTRGRLGISFENPIDPKRARKPVGGGGATPDYAKAVTFVRTPRR